jgi:TetR/AcrR family tetracycline transcriptional repressor
MPRVLRNSRQPLLRRDAIVAAALQVLDREGYTHLTLRRVAAELDVQAPAIYWHIKDKTELVDYMAEAILQKQFKDLTPRRDDEQWQEWLVDVMKQLRGAMWLYRDGGRIVTGAHLYPALTLVKIFDLSHQSLVSSGVPIEKSGQIIAATVHFVFGRVIEEQSGPTPEQRAIISEREELFAPYPYFVASMKSRRVAGDEFEAVVRAIINGLAMC